MIHPEVGEICLLEDGRAVQVLMKLGYGIYCCWVADGEDEPTIQVFTLMDLYKRTDILQTRPSQRSFALGFELN